MSLLYHCVAIVLPGLRLFSNYDLPPGHKGILQYSHLSLDDIVQHHGEVA